MSSSNTKKPTDLVTVAAVTVGTAVVTVGACAAFLALQLAKRRKKFNTPQPVFTDAVCPPHGHYSQAITHRGKLYVSGVLPMKCDGTKMCGDDFDEQVVCVLETLRGILLAGGSSVKKLVHCRVYLSDVQNWDRFNSIFSNFCGDTFPARCVVMVPIIHFGLHLELEAIAAL